MSEWSSWKPAGKGRLCESSESLFSKLTMGVPLPSPAWQAVHVLLPRVFWKVLHVLKMPAALLGEGPRTTQHKGQGLPLKSYRAHPSSLPTPIPPSHLALHQFPPPQIWPPLWLWLPTAGGILVLSFPPTPPPRERAPRKLAGR
jgi:hypothetical protein